MLDPHADVRMTRVPSSSSVMKTCALRLDRASMRSPALPRRSTLFFSAA
jgi:hypothetical protein